MSGPNLRALKIEMTITVGDLEDLASLLEGAIEAVEEAGGPALPEIFYDLVGKYSSLIAELTEATSDLYGLE